MKREDLLLEVFRKCYQISTNSKYDVFFDYAPHCNIYTIYYYINGWNPDDEPIYLKSDVDISRKITIKTLQQTIKELDKLWESIEVSNLKID